MALRLSLLLLLAAAAPSLGAAAIDGSILQDMTNDAISSGKKLLQIPPGTSLLSAGTTSASV